MFGAPRLHSIMIWWQRWDHCSENITLGLGEMDVRWIQLHQCWLEQITTTLELLSVRDARRSGNAPTFDGTGYVELFIKLFTDVVTASE